jgi:hypothetical protein
VLLGSFGVSVTVPKGTTIQGSSSASGAAGAGGGTSAGGRLNGTILTDPDDIADAMNQLPGFTPPILDPTLNQL